MQKDGLSIIPHQYPVHPCRLCGQEMKPTLFVCGGPNQRHDEYRCPCCDKLTELCKHWKMREVKRDAH